MHRRARAPLVLGPVFIGLLVTACSDRAAPEEAPPLASSAAIPPAALGATGVSFSTPARPPTPRAPTETAPQPLPLPVPPEKPDPLPEDEQPKPLPGTGGQKKDAGSGAPGPLPEGVHL